MRSESQTRGRALFVAFAALLISGVGCGTREPTEGAEFFYQPPLTDSIQWVTDPETGRMLSVVFPGDGEFLVGADLPAGIYIARGGPMCQWSRQSLRPDGSFGELQSGGGLEAQRVDVKSTDLLFRSAGCMRWEMAQ